MDTLFAIPVLSREMTMKGILPTLRRLGMNIITSGTFDKYQDDIGVFLRILLVNTIGIVAAPCLLGFGVYDIASGVLPTGWVITSIGLLVIFNFIFLRWAENYRTASWVAAILLYGGFAYLLATGGSGNTGPLWIYTLPGTMFILVGVQAGTWLTLLFFLFSGLGLFVPDSPLLFTRYSPDFVRRFIPTLFTAMALGYIFEYMRAASQKKIVRKNRELTLTVDELEKAGETIRESEEKYRHIFENIQDIYYETTLDGRILVLSPSFHDTFLYSREELPSLDAAALYADPARRKRFVEEISESGVVKDYEIILKDKDGREIPCALTARLIVDRGGKAEKICGTLRDISERKRLEHEILKSQKLDSIGILAGGLAHDFNNLLTAIMGNISFARLEAAPESDSARALRESEQACLQAKTLTNQLLTFSRGGKPVKKTMIINDLIRKAASFALSGSRSRCSFSLSTTLPPVEVDEGQINQVINNIVLNADQAMPKGGVVRVTAENLPVGRDSGLSLTEGDYVKISIADDGVGIPPENIHKIFDPYFTTREQGTGLGLATAYSIVKNHGGLIKTDSRPGEGTVVSVYLPASAKELPNGPRSEDLLATGKGRVLIMDDEEIVRNVAERLARRLGYEVVQANDGNEAIEKFREARARGAPFDAVILDLTVPGGMGGSRAVKIIREIDPEARVIVSSGYSVQAEMAAYRAMGFCDVLIKPYKISELSEVLRRCCQDVER